MSIKSMWIFIVLLVAIITKVRSKQYILYLEKTQPPVARGEYVEITLSFMLPSYFSGVPCADNEYLEIRDGYNQSANLLGVFCGRYIKSLIRRSSGHYMWLRFSSSGRYWLFYHNYYEGRAANKKVPAGLSQDAQTQFVLLNHSSSLWCPAEGGPAPRIVWRKNGAVVQNSTSVRLLINVTNEERNTNYSCEVESHGQLKRKYISLVFESCPEPCRCTVLKGNMKGIHVDCERKRLTSVPQNIPRATVKL
ncbi:uncharacterized protein LOC113677101 [Pocillopora damicornis]|uniref:uncharacterized protein LOC113677101 n=1 Tax=Pocillopora damicornis TaxID=46731 RepID=UPI000F558DD1|nr:uncharacterized protein LOC113677101 [Pocillopora damicornis]